MLDDNKKLCLTSGEMIKMSDGMTMMFEPEDLAVASPATVSRCGMVFVEPDYLCPSAEGPVSRTPFVQSWARLLPESLAPCAPQFEALFDTYAWDMLYMVRKLLKETVATVPTNIFPSMLRLLDTWTEAYRPKEGRVLEEDALLHSLNLVEPAFIFCLVWSVGATCTGPGRQRFDKELRHKMKSAQASMAFPKARHGHGHAGDASRAPLHDASGRIMGMTI